MTATVNLYDCIQSELLKKGKNEFVNDKGELIYFDSTQSFIQKITQFDDDVSSIVDSVFFSGMKLTNDTHDKQFKQSFLNRFLTREINRQTIEAFAIQVMYTFSVNQDYINRLYTDLDKYLLGKQLTAQSNNQQSDTTDVSDNRTAFAELPQNNVQLDVNSTIMTSAKDNTITRNKESNSQTSNNTSTSETSQYRLDELLKTNGLLEQVFTIFDLKCFLQIW